MLRQYRDLPTAVHILCLGTFINRAGSFIMLFLTFYLQERLDLGGLFATQAMGVFGAGTLLATLVGGQLADTIGRRKVMLVSLFGSAGILLAFSQVRTPAALLGATFLFAFLVDMYRPAVSAMMSDLVPMEERPHAFGLMYIAINLGAAVAPVVGGTLAAHAFEYLFWGDAATSVIYGMIIALTIKETLVRNRNKPATAAREEGHAKSAMTAYGRILRDATFVRFCLGTLFLSFVYVQAMSTLPLYMKGLSLGPKIYGQTIALNGALVVLGQVPMTHLVSRFHRTTMIVLAALTTGVGFGLHGLATTQLAFAAAVAVWTAGELMQSPLTPTIVSDLAPSDLRARYFGLLAMCFSGGNLIAAPVGGWVLVRYGGSYLWGGCVGTALVSAVLFASVRQRVPSSGARTP